MNVKIKKLTEDAVIPTRNNETDAGLDIVATGIRVMPSFVEYSTGLAIEIPVGYVGLIFPRSSISNYNLQLCNSVAVIDSGYRGEILCRFNIVVVPALFSFSTPLTYDIGDKIAQLIILPYPKVVLEVVEKLEKSERGENGFGSSGK